MGAFPLGSLAASLDAMVPATRPSIATSTQVSFRQAILSEAWEAVNAEGGTFDPNDPVARGRSEGLDLALAALERLGAGDPAPLRHRLSNRSAA